jgi:drug/metabolite transporter (DMT)-like permease
MNWISYAIGSAVALAAADFFIKMASGKLSNSLGLLIYGSCTFIAGLTWVLLDKIRGVGLHAQTAGVLSASGVGVAFSCVTVGLYLTFGAGAPITLVSPFIRFGGLIIASLAGLFILHEPLTLRYAAGMILAIGGVYLIITR